MHLPLFNVLLGFPIQFLGLLTAANYGLKYYKGDKIDAMDEFEGVSTALKFVFFRLSILSHSLLFLHFYLAVCEQGHQGIAWHWQISVNASTFFSLFVCFACLF